MNQISTHVFSQRMQAEGRDLTPVQFAALDTIIANPGIDQASVAARIAYDRATIGGVIDRLEQKGYVERTVSRRDRRAREVRATKLGQKEFDAILPIVEALQNDVLAGLDDPEKELFRTLAQKVIDYDAG
ncbi:MAG: MarR family transcriptional regulator [Donghicola eburneus]|nr:MarR family transcriptional regulator [Donghicola eburneus]MCI5039338.1 MarR family transcriptional regulator [Donghicola eburneus]